MKSSNWRIAARVVAFLNLLASALKTLVYISSFTMGIAMTTLSKEDFKHYLDEHAHCRQKENGSYEIENISTVALYLYWITMVILVAELGIQFWLTKILLEATKTGANSREAWHQSSTYFLVNLSFLAALVFLRLFNLAYGDSMPGQKLWKIAFNIFVMLDSVFLFIVGSFSKEMNKRIWIKEGIPVPLTQMLQTNKL